MNLKINNTTNVDAVFSYSQTIKTIGLISMSGTGLCNAKSSAFMGITVRVQNMRSLLRGGQANSDMVAMKALLGACLPNACVDIVSGAGHFLVTSHAANCAAKRSLKSASQA